MRQAIFLAALIGINFSNLSIAKVSLQPTHINETAVRDAISLLTSLGVPRDNFCSIVGSDLLPSCITIRQSKRYLQEEEYEQKEATTTTVEGEETTEDFEEDPWNYTIHVIGAAACVCTAALAAGLTMGLLSLDPLMMMIKMRAGTTEEEKQQAANILPIVQQHHLLLVTLLLLNSIANEALPLFLEELVSPFVAVILSVTLVLFGGEIIPSAIFTGPNKIALASKMTPVVRFVMILLWPIAYPIAKLLDHVLHDESEETGAFNRGELSALVRIQYEERLAFKQRNRIERESFGLPADQRLSLDLRNSKRISSLYTNGSLIRDRPIMESQDEDSFIDNRAPSSHADSVRESIHIDEVAMVEGALQMKTKTAWEVCNTTKIFSIPSTTILDEETVVSIYSQGYSRIPVYEPDPEQPLNRSRILGVFLIRQLIVVNPGDARPLNTLELHTPLCVSPKTNLVDLLNLFQKGKDGHLALVCTRPMVAEACLTAGEPLSARAGFVGIITMEDIVEELLQEEVFDEYDKEKRLARWAVGRWKNFVRRKKKEKRMSMSDVVSMVMNSQDVEQAGENTGLLGGEKKSKKFLGLF